MGYPDANTPDKTVKMIQGKLAGLGFQCEQDGRFGSETVRAVRAFQTKHAPPASGQMTGEFLPALNFVSAGQKPKWPLKTKDFKAAFAKLSAHKKTAESLYNNAVKEAKGVDNGEVSKGLRDLSMDKKDLLDSIGKTATSATTLQKMKTGFDKHVSDKAVWRAKKAAELAQPFGLGLSFDKQMAQLEKSVAAYRKKAAAFSGLVKKAKKK